MNLPNLFFAQEHEQWFSCLSASSLVSLSHWPLAQSNVFSGDECDVCCALGGGEAVKASLLASYKVPVFGFPCCGCEKAVCLGMSVCFFHSFCEEIIYWRLPYNRVCSCVCAPSRMKEI